MRLKELLSESPIGNFDVVGDMDGAGSFRHPDDRKLLTSQKAVAKIRRIFEKVPHIFDLCFIDSDYDVDDIRSHLDAYAGIYDSVKAAESRLKTKLPAPSSPSSTLIVFTNNEGSKRVPMTAWIIAHRLGHALYEQNDLQVVLDTIVMATQEFCVEFSELPDCFGLDALRAIGTMASCRNGTIVSSSEYAMECFAQYLLSGRVTMNRLDRTSVVKDSSGKNVKLNDAELLGRINALVDYAEKICNTEFPKMLEMVTGKVVVF